jgi:sugar O-acyltransferase (sialic acid O-acetyltransferase NeuD family)
MEEIVIFGAGGFGREVAWIIDDINRARADYRILGFIADNEFTRAGELLNGYPVLGGPEWLEGKKGISAAIALGSPVSRLAVLSRLDPYGLHYPNLIHPSVVIATGVQIGEGNVVSAGCILAVNSTISSFCQLNLHSTIGHDCVLENFATTACGVDLAGYSHIGFGAYMGNHVTVLPSVKVGAFATVGAGAAVNRDLPPGVTAVGVPAKVIKESPVYDELKTKIPQCLASIQLRDISQKA